MQKFIYNTFPKQIGSQVKDVQFANIEQIGSWLQDINNSEIISISWEEGYEVCDSCPKFFLFKSVDEFVSYFTHQYEPPFVLATRNNIGVYTDNYIFKFEDDDMEVKILTWHTSPIFYRFYENKIYENVKSLLTRLSK